MSKKQGLRKKTTGINVVSLLVKIGIFVGILFMVDKCVETIGQSNTEESKVRYYDSNVKIAVIEKGKPFFYNLWRNKGFLVIDTNGDKVYVSAKTRDGSWTQEKEYTTGVKPFPFSGDNIITFKFKADKKIEINLKQRKYAY